MRTNQISKHGEGYSSSKYTAPQPDSGNDSEGDIQSSTSRENLPTDPTIPTSSTDDICEVCGYTEGEGIVGIGLGIRLPPGDIEWVCDRCDTWFHLLCLDKNKEDIPEDEWICDKC